MDIGSNTEYYAFDFLDRGDCAIREDEKLLQLAYSLEEKMNYKNQVAGGEN